jgi:hypothetical protein
MLMNSLAAQGPVQVTLIVEPTTARSGAVSVALWASAGRGARLSWETAANAAASARVR